MAEMKEIPESVESLVERTTLLPAEIYQLPSVNSVQTICKHHARDTQLNVNTSTLLKIDQAKIYFDGAACLVESRDGQELAKYGANLEEKLGQSIPCKKLNGTTLLLGYSQGAHCYYHWMVDILPKIGLLEKANLRIDDIDHILVREVNGSFQRETLERLGVDFSKVIETKDNPLFQCESLLHINLLNGISMKMNRFVPAWLNDVFKNPAESSKGLKLYISRPAGVRRGVSNEDELVPILKKHGYVVKAMEGMTVAAQANLLSKVDVLISPHGGALTNMVFAKPGIRVVELFGRHVYPFYYGLAALCGHQYHAILENPAEDFRKLVSFDEAAKAGSADQQRKTRALPFSVDPVLFRQTLQTIG